MASVSVGGLVAESADSRLLSLTCAQETELPATAKLTFIAPGGDSPRSVAEAGGLAGFSECTATASLAMMLEAEHAQEIAERWLHEAWAVRRRAAFVLPPSKLAVEPRDAIETDEDSARLLHRVTQITDRGCRAIEAAGVDPKLYDGHAAPSRSWQVAAQPIVGAPEAFFLDLPLILDGGVETDGYAALHKAQWPGPMALYSAPGEDGFAYAGHAIASATVATLLDDLPVGATARFDPGPTVRVMLWSGTLASVSRLALLEGANAVVVRGDDGSWEVCQFETPELVDERTYELKGWLRGQLGTDIGRPRDEVRAAAGQPMIVLNSALVRLAIGTSGVDRPLNWRYGRAFRDLADAGFAQTAHTFTGLARRPYAPVRLRGQRNGAGDLTITWIRRARQGGDSWEQGDVPVGEESEAYEVDVVIGSAVVRTILTDNPEALYTAAEQVAEFGASQSQVRCRICQVGAGFGRGAPAEVLL